MEPLLVKRYGFQEIEPRSASLSCLVASSHRLKLLRNRTLELVHFAHPLPYQQLELAHDVLLAHHASRAYVLHSYHLAEVLVDVRDFHAVRKHLELLLFLLVLELEDLIKRPENAILKKSNLVVALNA